MVLTREITDIYSSSYHGKERHYQLQSERERIAEMYFHNRMFLICIKVITIRFLCIISFFYIPCF